MYPVMTQRILLLSVASAFVAATACNTTISTFEDDENDPNGICGAFQDEESIGDATVRFVNETNQNVYLPETCGLLTYGIDGQLGDDVHYRGPGSCTQSCGDLQTNSRYDCGLGACQETVRVVPPGGSVEVTWGGRGSRQAEMPASCWLDASAESTCAQVVAAQPGTYEVSITGYASCMSYDNTPCVCSNEGSCEGAAAGPEVSLRVAFDFPATSPAEVTFENCAFGCAGDGTN